MPFLIQYKSIHDKYADIFFYRSALIRGSPVTPSCVIELDEHGCYLEMKTIKSCVKGIMLMIYTVGAC